MNLKGNLKNNVLFNFLATYIVIILVVASFFYPIYTATLKSVNGNAVNDVYNSLQNSASFIDNEIMKMQEMARVFRNNSSFSSLINLSDKEINNEHYYNMISAWKFMYNVFLPTDMLAGSYFIYKNNSVVISREIVSEKHSKVYGNYFKAEGKSEEQWFQWIGDFSAKNIRIFKPDTLYMMGNGINSPQLSKQMVTYVLPVTNESSINVDSILICLLDSNILLKRLCPQDILKGGFLNVTDPQGQVILSYPSGKGMPEYQKPGVNDFIINHVKMTIMSTQTKNAGLIVTVGIPSAVFTEKIEEVMSKLRLFFILSIFIGLLAALIFSYRNSLPLRRLLKTVSQVYSDVNKQRGAYEDIREALLELGRLKESYREEINALLVSVKTNLFDRLIKGAPPAEDIIEEASKHLDFLSDDYTLLVIRFMEPLIPKTHETNSSLQEYDTLVKVIAVGVIRKHLHQTVFVHSLFQDKIAIVLRMDEKERISEEFGTALGNCLREISEKAMSRLYAGLSLTGNGIEEIRLCYCQAMAVLRMETGERVMGISYYTKEMERGQNHSFGIREIQKLYELLLSGDSKQVETILEDIYQEMLRRKSISELMVRHVYNNILNIIIFAERDISKEAEIDLEIDGYSEDKSFAELFNQLKESALNLCTIIEKRKTSRNIELRESILEYVNGAYADAGLCAASIAERCAISEKYLFNFIREQTGKSFSEYLEEIRIEKAKQLLLETDNDINDIAGLAGYFSHNTFYKVFKKVTGVSPSSWRKSRRCI